MTRRRSLSARERERLFNLHGGVCHFCGLTINPAREAWDISHELPLELGGEDDDKNRQPAHRLCHRQHTSETDAPRIAKMRRQRQKNMGLRTRKSWGFQTNRDGKWRKKMDGTVERRE